MKPIYGSNSSGKSLTREGIAAVVDLVHKSSKILSPAKVRPSRNSPCPCGSGRKFKVCCSPKIQERA